MPMDNLSPPGSSSYSSNTMFVGDGTWDSSRNSFLLPNLQGLNLATTQYNGMGNRFRDLPEYHQLILGHGVLAAITFLFLVPLSIFLAKYGHSWPGARVSFKLHIYIHIIVIFLSTVILVLGWFAVGPERSLSNPHHGIGVAIYTLLIFLFLYSWLMYRHERRRSRPIVRLPFAVWIHNLLGRAIALLAIVQVALGLTLYGSPKALFVLYALACAFMVFLYLALDYHYKLPIDDASHGGGRSHAYSDYGSYTSGSRTDMTPAPQRRKESHWGRDLLAAGGILGAYEAYKHRRDRKAEEREDRMRDRHDNRPSPPQGRAGMSTPGPGRPPGPGGIGPTPIGGVAGVDARRSSRPPSQSRVSRESWEDEKYNDRPRHTWRDRILGAAGGIAAFEGVKSIFGRRRRREDDYDDDDSRYGGGRYGQSSVGPNRISPSDVSRVEAGQAPMSPDTPRVNMGGVQPATPSMTPSRPPRGSRPAGGNVSFESRESFDTAGRPFDDEGPHTLRDSIAVFGAVAGFREWNKRRKDRREAQRLGAIRRQELDNEDVFQRRNENRYPRPQDASGAALDDSTVMTGGTGPASAEAQIPGAPNTWQPPLPANAGSIQPPGPIGAHETNVTNGQGYSLPPPPPGPPPMSNSGPYAAGPPEFGSAQMPQGAVNPDPSRLVSDPQFTAANTAANAASAFGRDYSGRSGREAAEAGVAGGALGAAGAAAMAGRSGSESQLSPTGQHSRRDSRNRLHRGSVTQSSASQLNSGAVMPPPQASNPASPPVSVKVNVHNDGRHVTLRRLNEEEAAAERAARRQERRSQRRRDSSLSSGIEDGPPPTQRYRRAGGIRSSNDQPITNIPPPPPMSSSAGGSHRRPSDLTLPPPQGGPLPPSTMTGGPPPAAAGATPPVVPQHSISPSQRPPMNSPPPSGLYGPPESGVGSPGTYGTDTEGSAFADNRRRRRAERARKLEAARGMGGGGAKVEFQ